MTEDTSLLEVSTKRVEWSIKNFFDLPTKKDYFIQSLSFSFSGAKWYLSIYPNGEIDIDFENDDVNLYLHKEKSASKHTISYRMGIKKSNGSECHVEEHKYSFPAECEGWGTFDFILRSTLQNSKDTLTPGGTLTIFCEICTEEQLVLSSVALQTSLSDDDSILSEDFKDMYISKCCSDVAILVQDKEFFAHRCVLAARSTVFASMFQHEMAEKNSGKVEISDCDPSSFDEFLLFLYTGKLDNVPSTKAVNLYKTANKYDVKQLKEKCVDIMCRDLCVDLFCEVIYLATLHFESDLLKATTDFFIQNVETILPTAKWIQFSEENFVISNELFMKFVKSKK